MSVWTQVVGCIRVDGFFGIDDEYTVDVFEHKLGPICSYHDWNEESTLPRGSEGSLGYDILTWDDGEGNVYPTGVIPIYGSLRSYDDVEEITKWWNDTLAKFRSVRDAVLRIEVGYGGGVVTILQYTRPTDEELYGSIEE